MSDFDKRLTPARPDLAAAHLRGKVEAARFVEGRRMQVAAPLADVKSAPSPDASLDTQALCGEIVTVYERNEGWAWAQLQRDSYVGYVPEAALSADVVAPTHHVAVRATFVYPGPNMKLPPLATLPFLAAVAAVETNGEFMRLAHGGFVFARHLADVAQRTEDFVTVAESMLGAPYLWGGKTPAGVDCSGLVQVALHAAGADAPRDTDMQARALGFHLPVDESPRLQRGDLVFWKGHVGIMRDADTLLHANGHHMLVASEPLRQARERIAANSYGAITAIKRLA
ncbi:MAG: C40 family peptidase [Hyphomicrobiales bacterium]|nr:C40 family peptidase [Hyphomicrobiales bacterium]